MGHSKNRGRRRLTLPLPLRAKMTGLAMFVGGFMGLVTSAQLDPISAYVHRVIDGDTIHVQVERKRYTVRLIGVDTPETKHPTKPVQYFGQEASAFTKAALEGKTVMLQKDRTGDTVDRYGRRLRYVLLDGDNFNAGSSATATLMLTGAFPARSGRSLFNSKNKRGGEGSAYGTAAEIAVSQTRPPVTPCTIGRLSFP